MTVSRKNDFCLLIIYTRIKKGIQLLDMYIFPCFGDILKISSNEINCWTLAVRSREKNVNVPKTFTKVCGKRYFLPLMSSNYLLFSRIFLHNVKHYSQLMESLEDLRKTIDGLDQTQCAK